MDRADLLNSTAPDALSSGLTKWKRFDVHEPRAGDFVLEMGVGYSVFLQVGPDGQRTEVQRL
jgi:hypothetical protein